MTEFSPVRWVLDGGLTMRPILVCGVLAIVAGLGGLILRRREAALAAALAAVFCLVVGAVGYWLGMRELAAVLATIEPDLRAAVVARGEAIALIPAITAAALAAPALLLGVLGLVVTRGRP